LRAWARARMRSLRLVAAVRPPNLRSWSCQATALASSSRLLRKAPGGLPSVAVQMARSSARPAVLSSESLGIAGCLMCLSPPGTTQARFSLKVQSPKSPFRAHKKERDPEQVSAIPAAQEELASCDTQAARNNARTRPAQTQAHTTNRPFAFGHPILISSPRFQPFRKRQDHKKDRRFESPPLYRRGTANRQRSHLHTTMFAVVTNLFQRDAKTRLLVGWDRQFESPPLQQRGTANPGPPFLSVSDRA
jgi:hypothetical protein